MSLEPPEFVIQKMSYFLSREKRLKLFNELIEVLGKPTPERVSLATGISKTHVYRYLPGHKPKRLAPNAQTTTSIIKALLRNGRFKPVLQVFNHVAMEMRETYREYFYWEKKLRKNDIIPNPLSRKEIARLKKSL